MKRLVVIAEGETEERFVNDILRPYFNSLGIYSPIQCFKTKHSNGGLSKYSYIKQDIIQTIYETDVVVTTLLDFYRLPSDFPGYKGNNALPHNRWAEIIESQMKEDIEQTQGRCFDNFIPYVQLHEFEALIFSSIAGIDALFERSEVNSREDFQAVIDSYPNPEDINNGPNSAPSVRLKKLIPGYDKVVYGFCIISEIGMEAILSKCPRFNGWIKKLKDALNETNL